MSVGIKQLRQLTTVLIASPPGVNDDALQNYMVGSTVYSISDQTFYECSDNTPGAAVWGAVSFGGGGWIVVSSNQTAVNDQQYSNVANATYTDPTPVEGKGFIVLVRNGTATVGGTGYAVAGTLIYRIYHSGAWANYPYYSGVPQDSCILGSGYSNQTIAAGNTRYLAVLPQISDAQGTTVAQRQMPSPLAGTASLLYFTTFSAQPASGSLVLTFVKNGSDQAVTITIPAGSAAGVFSDTSNSFSIAAGDLLCLKAVNNATGASAGLLGSSWVLTR